MYFQNIMLNIKKHYIKYVFINVLHNNIILNFYIKVYVRNIKNKEAKLNSLYCKKVS
ncbi:hypothetical protein UT300005_16220 [Clostridium sp. CTA-5]